MKRVRNKMLKGCLLAILGLVASLTFVQPVLAEETSSSDWKFTTFLYAWAPDIKGQTTTGKDLDISFSDIVKNLDFTVMGGVNARKDKLSLLVDVIYLDVDDSSNATLPNGPLDIKRSITNVNIQTWVVTPMVGYNILESDRMTLDLLAGARYLYMDVETKYEVQRPLETIKFSPSGSTHYWDGIVGTMGRVKLNEKWYLPFQGDVGTGDTNLTWQLFGGVGYKFTNLELIAGYRHLEWDFDSNDKGGEILNDIYISGPVVGLRYTF